MPAIGPFDGYVFDLDGTVYLDDRVLPGAAEAIAGLRARDARVVFVTNKPTATAETYAATLTAGGIPATAADVVTSVDTLCAYLAERHPGAKILPVAEPVVHEALEQAGFVIVAEPTEATVVVIAFDRTFDYGKLLAAYRAVLAGAVIVATNPDPVCPTASGGLPDCAAMLAAVEACTGKSAEAVVGKPSLHMARTFLARLGLSPERTVIVGDRLATDIAMGRAVGMATVLVSNRGDARPTNAATAPDAVVASLLELL